MYGHPGLHVVDGSAISANLGVNPSLTITAQAERAMALWPNKGDPDQRPPLGEPYRRLDPIAPAVPSCPPGLPRRSADGPNRQAPRDVSRRPSRRLGTRRQGPSRGTGRWAHAAGAADPDGDVRGADRPTGYAITTASSSARSATESTTRDGR